ncbi:MAG: hypothetical protein BWY09_00693 [Candidatus Hydrogenedentes bacterium ADurb.Bin179]|nr:MAG: hypothetical protein BWY09_00693 [Candidatus Hydrogenedentes bacterium ADurb.Bin179]
MEHLYLECRRPLDLHGGQRTAIEGDSRIIRNTGTGDQTAEIHLYTADTDFIAPDNEFFFHLSGHSTVTGKDAAEGYHAIHRQDVGQAAIWKT